MFNFHRYRIPSSLILKYSMTRSDCHGNVIKIEHPNNVSQGLKKAVFRRAMLQWNFNSIFIYFRTFSLKYSQLINLIK